MTTVSCKNGAITTTLSRMSFSGCVGHVILVGLESRLGLGLDIPFNWLVVMHTYFHCVPL